MNRESIYIAILMADALLKSVAIRTPFGMTKERLVIILRWPTQKFLHLSLQLTRLLQLPKSTQHLAPATTSSQQTATTHVTAAFLVLVHISVSALGTVTFTTARDTSFVTIMAVVLSTNVVNQILIGTMRQRHVPTFDICDSATDTI
mmetsp:Transcript_6447/g.18961  ORF Transcript_6447/g.18961 Transcript_6447/m.18961 type:complete len:147 (-) Transcript_6447:242-682(-)